VSFGLGNRNLVQPSPQAQYQRTGVESSPRPSVRAWSNLIAQCVKNRMGGDNVGNSLDNLFAGAEHQPIVQVRMREEIISWFVRVA